MTHNMERLTLFTLCVMLYALCVNMNIIFGLIGIAIGILFVIKSEALLNTFGRINFFETKLRLEGGSRLGYKLIGIVIIFIGALILTNMIGGFMNWLLSPILKWG